MHTWQYEGISSPYGMCAAYPDLTTQLAARLHAIARDLHKGAVPREKVRSLVSNSVTCPVCQVRIAAEKEATAQVADMARRSVESKNAHAPALCLPHLAMLADSVGAGEPAARMLQGHAELLESTAEDLQRYAVKHEALRRHLASQEEHRAAKLALLLLAGHRNVSAPWVIEKIF